MVTVGSEQRDIPASDFHHDLQKIVDVAADLLSRCSELNLQREEGQRSSGGIQDRVDAAAHPPHRYFEAGSFSCEASNHETQGSSDPHEVSEDPPALRAQKHVIAEGFKSRGIREIADVAADLLHKCFELLDSVSPNQTQRENQGKSVPNGEQGENGNIPARDTKVSKCYEALQHIADIAADVLYRCFVLLDLQSSHQEKEEHQRSSAPLKIGDRQQNIT